MLKDKVAVIYGAGGDVGGAVARAFAREGAKLFLSGRHLRKVESLAADVIGRGGVAEAAQNDALEEQAVDTYVGAVAAKAGSIDISFNAIGISNALPQRAPLLELPAAQFALPITTYTQAHFLTARIERRRHGAGICGGRRADPHPLRRARTAGGPGGVPHAERDARDGNDPRKF